MMFPCIISSAGSIPVIPAFLPTRAFQDHEKEDLSYRIKTLVNIGLTALAAGLTFFSMVLPPLIGAESFYTRLIMQAKRIKLKLARIERGYSQKQIADSVGITVGAYVKHENGYMTLSADRCRMIADVMNIDVELVLGGDSVSK